MILRELQVVAVAGSSRWRWVPIETSSTAVERDTEGPIDAGEVMTVSEEAVVREISGFSGDVAENPQGWEPQTRARWDWADTPSRGGHGE